MGVFIEACSSFQLLSKEAGVSKSSSDTPTVTATVTEVGISS